MWISEGANDMTLRSEPGIPSRAAVWRMFDRIAHRYDLLNHLLSLNRDIVWREQLSSHLPERNDQTVLDLATGTADQLFSMYRTGKVKSGVGLDMSASMLAHGKGKIRARALGQSLTLIRGDAEMIPFGDGSVDAVSISFGIRNVTDVRATLMEMRRVLSARGRVLILEFSLPASWMLKRPYLFYFRHILPRLGGLISGDQAAYRYLNETVETFPYGNTFCELMTQVGFRNVCSFPLTFGIATIYQGDR